MLEQYFALPKFLTINILGNPLIDYIAILVVTWIIAKTADLTIQYYFKPKDKRIYKQVMPVLRRITKILIWTFAIVFILDNSGINVATLIAGLGIGGLAVAFAAKETIENLIAGMLIFAGRPFIIGDWVKIGETEGTIHAVGLRETMIKGFDDKIIIIPNKNIVSTPVENYSIRKERRVEMELRLAFDNTPAKIKKAKELITKILDKHKIAKETRFINFLDIKQDYYSLLAYYWVEKTEWANIKETVNFEVLYALNKAKIELAYPSVMQYNRKG